MTSGVEAELLSLLQQQQSRYRQAAELADQLLAQLDAGEDPTGPLNAMRAALDQVAIDDGRLRQVREAWDRTGRPRSHQLQQTLTDLESTLVGLIGKVGAAEGRAAEAKSRLQPELTEATRRGQMQRAYHQQSADS
jgi:hypothetical protein